MTVRMRQNASVSRSVTAPNSVESGRGRLHFQLTAPSTATDAEGQGCSLAAPTLRQSIRTSSS
jgi:hypothetical protein